MNKAAVCDLFVKVIPRSGKNEIIGWENNELKIRLKAIPDKGEANAELIEVLADNLGIAKSQITLISGQKSRHKRLRIQGLSSEELYNNLLKLY